MVILGEEISLTWNLVFSVIAIPAVGWWIRRKITKSDTTRKQLDQANTELLSSHFQSIDAKQNTLCDKIDKHMEQSEKIHDELWDRVYQHGHTVVCNKDCTIETKETTVPRHG